MPPSRMDRLIKVLGGEENLPPKLPQQAAVTPQQQAINPLNQDIQPIDDFLQEQSQSQGSDWWNSTPPQTQSKPVSAVTPSTSPMTSHFDARKDEPAPLGLNFCPFIAVTKLPYKFVKKEFTQAIATAFFDEGKIWNREWEVYYIWSSLYETAKPVTFVPESQVLALLDEINSTFPKANVRISDSNREEGLVINFDDITYSDLRPRFLGCSTSRNQLENWTASLPAPTPISGNMDIPSRTLEAFKEKLELAVEISKNKSKVKKKERQGENIAKRQDMVRMLTRGQRYLGLAGKGEEASLMPDIPSLSIATVNANAPAPYPFDNDVIFISVDVEAWEDPPNPITEVGVATLDTRDLRQHAPGTNGEGWQKSIRARHFRIDEHKRRCNHKYVDGCPDKFEFNNHQSTFVPGAHISKTVSDCFNPPYGNDTPNIKHTLEKRNVVLVGHDITQDINYLRKIGISLANFSCIVDTVDTANLFRVYTHEPSSRSLGHILGEFDLMGWHLHNAGNDAVYTLWAMMAICVKHAAAGDEVAEKREQKLREREEAAIELAKERVRDESEGWDGTGDDGGVPVLPTSPQADGSGGKSGQRVLYTAGGNVLDV